MTEEELILFFSLYRNFLTKLGGVYTDNLITEILRRLAWSLILFLRRLCISIEDLYYKVFDVIDVVRSEEILSFASGLSGYVYVMLVMSLLVTGYRMIASESFDLRRAITNLVITILILSGAFSVIGSLAQLTHVSIRGLSGMADTAGADEMIAESVIDIAYRYEKGILMLPGMTSDDIWEDNRVLTPTDIEMMDVNEKISETLGENTLPFSYTCRVDKNGGISVEEFSDRSFAEDSVNWLRELVTDIPKYRLSYARYHVEFGTLLISMVALSAAYIFSVFKVFAIVFELAMSSIMLGFTAVTDLEGGLRLKRIVSGILGCFLTLFAMAVVFRFYSVILTSTMRLSIVRHNRIVRTIAILAYTLAVMDGPNIIRALLGTDTRTPGMSAVLGGTYRGTYMAGSAVSFVAGAAAGALRTAGSLIKTSPAPRNSSTDHHSDRLSEEKESESRFLQEADRLSEENLEYATPASSAAPFTDTSPATEDTSFREDRYSEQSSDPSDNAGPGSIRDTDISREGLTQSSVTQEPAMSGRPDVSPSGPEPLRFQSEDNGNLRDEMSDNRTDPQEASGKEKNNNPKRENILRSRRKEEHDKKNK